VVSIKTDSRKSTMLTPLLVTLIYERNTILPSKIKVLDKTERGTLTVRRMRKTGPARKAETKNMTRSGPPTSKVNGKSTSKSRQKRQGKELKN
jgi:hypothetical protein